MRLKENKKNKNEREDNMTILWNDNGWSSGNFSGNKLDNDVGSFGNKNRKLHKITIDNKLFEYRIATKNEVKKWKKQLENKFGKNRVKIEREVA